jgi:hypothetical protein
MGYTIPKKKPMGGKKSKGPQGPPKRTAAQKRAQVAAMGKKLAAKPKAKPKPKPKPY